MAGMLVNGPGWFGGPWDRYSQEQPGSPVSEDSVEQNREESENNDCAGDLQRQEEARLNRLEPRIKELEKMDQAVREHEQMHKAVAGPYAGEITYRFVTGPDGKRYAVGGSTPLGAPQCRRPEEAIRVMNKLRQAAMAPGDPSPEDLHVARMAAMREQEARAEIRRESAAEREQDSEQMLEETGLRKVPEMEIKKDADGRVEITYHPPKPSSKEELIPGQTTAGDGVEFPGSTAAGGAYDDARSEAMLDVQNGQAPGQSAGRIQEIKLPGASKPESGESLPGTSRKPDSIGEAYRMAARIYRQQALLSTSLENHK